MGPPPKRLRRAPLGDLKGAPSALGQRQRIGAAGSAVFAG